MVAEKVVQKARIYSRYTDFRCTGSECCDNCCRAGSWSISIDDETYNKYKSLPDSPIKRKLEEAITIKKEKVCFKADENLFCQMLSEDGLCQIHSALGPDYLCQTCQVYPRKKGFFADIATRSLSLSCPVAARLVLFDRKGFGVSDIEVLVDEKPDMEVREKDKVCIRVNRAMLDMIRNRHIPMFDRLLFLGLMAKALDKVPENEDYEAGIIEVLERYQRMAELPGLLDDIKQNILDNPFPDKRNLYYQIMELLHKSLVLESPGVNREFYDRLDAFAADWEGIAGLDLDKIKNRLVDDYFRSREIVMENYFASNLLSEMIPLGYDSFEQAMRAMVTLFLMLEQFITGVYHQQAVLKDKDFINCVYYFHRKLYHNAKLKEWTMQFCKNNPQATFGMLVCLLHDS